MRTHLARFRPRVEGLEVRDVPSAVTAVDQTFDTTPVAGLPADWAEWTNDRPGGFAVADERSLSPDHGLTTTGGSATEARTWADTVLTYNAEASASVFAGSLIPATVFARGQHLDTDSPSYYGASVTRGLGFQLVRVVDGDSTVLGSVKSKDYVSQKWVTVTLTVVGSEVKASVVRTDTNEFLTPAGRWQADPVAALTMDDSAIIGAGRAGVVRPAKYAGTVTFDDFRAVSLGGNPVPVLTPPVVTLTASQPPAGVTGSITFHAEAEASSRVVRVEFKLDGRTLHAKSSAPAGWTFDTAIREPGPHTLVVRAIDANGMVGTSEFAFTIAEPETGRPELARNFDHIRIAQLAYSNTPFGDFEADKAATAVDLVISNVKFLDPIDAVAPALPQIIYTNVSNIYLDLLADWSNYADAVGVSRESAFYHVGEPTAWRFASGSAYPVDRFWDVALTHTAAATENLTSVAYSRSTSGPQFPIAGQTLLIGYLDEFREINFNFTRGALPGWAGVVEYPIVIAADGTPTAWKAVPFLTDGTGKFTRAGRFTFDPPADWVASAREVGAARLFYVRVRATAGSIGQAPIASTILGRDADNSDGLMAGGVIPAFDTTADTNADGYLNDAEFAQRQAGFDARFVYESRLHYPNYGPNRLVVNPASTAIKNWAADYQNRYLAEFPQADGIFIDNSNGRLPTGGASVVEDTSNYSAEYTALVGEVRSALSDNLVFANTVGGRADANPVAAAATGAIEEFLLRPMQVTWSAVRDTANLVAGRLAADNPAPYVVLDTHPGGGGNPTDSRTQLGALAYYYLVADPDRTFVMFFGGDNPSAAWSDTWIEAAEVNVGRPTGPMTVVASGADPANSALEYRVYGRDYDKATVLFKPRSYNLGQGTGTTTDVTATTHELSGTYRPIHADGTLGPVQANPTVTLRNGEGAILLKV